MSSRNLFLTVLESWKHKNKLLAILESDKSLFFIDMSFLLPLYLVEGANKISGLNKGTNPDHEVSAFWKSSSQYHHFGDYEFNKRFRGDVNFPSIAQD